MVGDRENDVFVWRTCELKMRWIGSWGWGIPLVSRLGERVIIGKGSWFCFEMTIFH